MSLHTYCYFYTKFILFLFEFDQPQLTGGWVAKKGLISLSRFLTTHVIPDCLFDFVLCGRKTKSNGCVCV